MAMPLVDQIQHGLQYVALNQIWPNPLNPRQRFEPEALAELVASVRELGILEPLVLTPATDAIEGYLVVAGERRRQAAVEVGLTWVPAVIRELGEREQMEIMLTENIQRADLDPVEEARGIQQLLDECGLKQEQLAKRLGKSQPWISNRLRLLRLPEPVLARVQSGELSAGHAQVLLKYEKSPSLVEAAAKEIVERKIPVADVEQKALSYIGSKGEDFRVLGSYGQAFAARGCPKCESYVVSGYQKLCLNPDCYDQKQAAGLAEKSAKVQEETGGLTIEGLRKSNTPYADSWTLKRAWDDVCETCDKLRKAMPSYGEKPETICLDPECARAKIQAADEAETQAAMIKLEQGLAQILQVGQEAAARLEARHLAFLLMALLRTDRGYTRHVGRGVEWPGREEFLQDRFNLSWPGNGWSEDLNDNADGFSALGADLQSQDPAALRAALVEWTLLSGMKHLGPALSLVGFCADKPEAVDNEDDYDQEVDEEL